MTCESEPTPTHLHALITLAFDRLAADLLQHWRESGHERLTLSHFLNVLRFVSIDGVRPLLPGTKLIGRARTLLYLPYRNMIYIGDSETDIPSMRVVQKKGGLAVGVYNPAEHNRRRMCDLFLEQRVDFFAPADYSQGMPLYRIVCKAVDLAAARAALAAETQVLRTVVENCGE